MTDKLTRKGRPEYDPWQRQNYFVLCEKIILSGMWLEFGDPVPESADIMHVHHHYYNGVIGTKKELECCVDPVELHYSNPEGPIAKFAVMPDTVPAPEEKDDERGTFALENAKLLKTKKDLAGYAEQFDIELPVEPQVSMKKMLELLEEKAKEKGLLE